MRWNPEALAATIMLGCMTAAAPLATDMYLPSLPAISREMAASVSQTQLTLSGQHPSCS